jgi:hypothetical protein
MADFQDISIFVTLRHEIEAGEKRLRAAALVEKQAEWKRQKLQQEQDLKQAEPKIINVEDTQEEAHETAGETATLEQVVIDVDEALSYSRVF